MANQIGLAAVAEVEDTMKNKFLTFLIDGGCYGVEIKYVTEITGMQPITTIPELDGYIKGVMNLRGKIIPILDVRTRFGKPEKVPDERTCIIVVDMKNIQTGLVVDEVCDVAYIDDEFISPSPQVADKKNDYICGVARNDGIIKLLIDCRKLLTGQEKEILQSAIGD